MGIVMPFIWPAETLTTVITFGSYFISNCAPAKLLTYEILTKTWKFLLLFAVAGAVMDTIGVGVGVGVGAGVAVGVGVGVGVTGPELEGQKMTAHTIATIMIMMAAIT
jgi:hypothetical protein